MNYGLTELQNSNYVMLPYFELSLKWQYCSKEQFDELKEDAGYLILDNDNEFYKFSKNILLGCTDYLTDTWNNYKTNLASGELSTNEMMDIKYGMSCSMFMDNCDSSSTKSYITDIPVPILLNDNTALAKCEAEFLNGGDYYD